MQWPRIILLVAIWCAAVPAVAQTVPQPEEPATRRPVGDWYRGEAGARVDFGRARDAHREVLFGAPAHVPRAFLEQAITLAMGSAWYWSSKGLNASDWDLQPTLSNFGRRFHDPSVFRFDTNRFFVNQGHLLAGSVHYAIPRNNNFGPYASLGAGILTSALWEWVFEYREYLSINDLIASPYGGQPLGEVTFKLGELWARQRHSLSLPAKIVGFPFGQGRVLHAWLGDREPEFPAEFGPAMAHDFRFHAGAQAYGTALSDISTFAGGVRLQTEVVDLPGYGREGEFATFFRDGNFTWLDIDVLIGDKPYFKRFTAKAYADLLGHYAQSISANGDGWAHRIGLGRGVWVDARQQLGDVDRLGVVDLVGAHGGLDLRLGGALLRAEGGLYADFGSVTSLAFAQAEIPAGLVRSELESQGNYYAWGFTATPRVTVRTRRVEGRARLDLSTFQGLRGPDRIHHNAVPREVRLRDRRAVFAAEAAFRLTETYDLTLRYERYARRSELDDTLVVRAVEELGAAVGARF